MPIQRTTVKVGEVEYELEHLSGHAARRAFHLVFRCFGDAVVKISTGGDLSSAFEQVGRSAPEDIDQIVALVAPKTWVRKVTTMAGSPVVSIPLDWDSHFVGPMALHQYRILFEHVKWNFGDSFLGSLASLVSSSKEAEPKKATE